MVFEHNSNYSETLIDTYLFTYLNSINHQVNNSYLSQQAIFQTLPNQCGKFF